MKCVYCGGENLKKNGKSGNGSQLYYCKDCNKTFTDHSGCKRPKAINGRCPHCGSKNLKYKGWNASGSRRYECKDCGKCSSGEPVEIKVKKNEKECPYCHSTNLTTNGYLKDGKNRRYHCKDCGRYFSPKTIIKEKSGINCVKCGSDETYLYGKTERGKDIFKCKKCGKRFVEHPDNAYKKHDIICPKCGKVGARKDGNSGLVKGGYKQYYKCLSCGHRYTLDPINLTALDKEKIIELYKQGVPILHLAEQFNVSRREISRKVQGIPNPVKEKKKELKQEMIKEILDGKPIKSTALKYGYAPKSLSRFMTPYYEAEEITVEQKQMIIKYGINCSVPVNYLAEYVHCSEYMCKKVIEEYMKNKIG